DSLGGLNGSPVWDVERSGAGPLWLETGRGLYVYRSGKLEMVLAGTDTRRIIVDESAKTVWCATAGKGLFRILFDKHGTVLSRFNTEHGLPSDIVFTMLLSRTASRSEELWLGTNRGITRYEPGSVAPVLRATRILGQRPFQTEQLSAGFYLEYPQNSLLIDVAVVMHPTLSPHI